MLRRNESILSATFAFWHFHFDIQKNTKNFRCWMTNKIKIICKLKAAKMKFKTFASVILFVPWHFHIFIFAMMKKKWPSKWKRNGVEHVKLQSFRLLNSHFGPIKENETKAQANKCEKRKKGNKKKTFPILWLMQRLTKRQVEKSFREHEKTT